MTAPRVRFAPSPTGYFHVGSARTALFNWFIARQHLEGVFILRIEDTDETRNREEWVDGIVSAMEWLGLSPDIGPYRQSDHDADHRAAVATLIAGGRAYYCDCTADDVAARKGDNKTPGYDGFCRDRGLSAGERTAVRFATPDSGSVVVRDLIRGDVVFDHSVIDDFVVAKSSGAVLYALANVVDDRRDLITHVIRGEEHLPNAPKQMLLWEALNELTSEAVNLPVYAHLPLLVNEQRKKLSKRKDPVATELYRDQGYLADAFVNYLSLLGWSPRGDEEMVDRSTCVSQFRLEDVSHSPAFFDVKKLTAMNGDYIRRLGTSEFLTAVAPWVNPSSSDWCPTEHPLPWASADFRPELFAQLAPLVQERIATLSEAAPMVSFFFLPDPPYDEVAFDKVIRNDEAGRNVLRACLDLFAECPFDAEDLHHLVADAGERLGLNLRKTQAPLRCAVTGTLVGPPLFESLAALGRDEVRRRVAAALER